MILALFNIWNTPLDVNFFDSGELIPAAYGLGISHPPGQPFYELLTKALILIPFGSIPFRCHLVSLIGAIALFQMRGFQGGKGLPLFWFLDGLGCTWHSLIIIPLAVGCWCVRKNKAAF